MQLAPRRKTAGFGVAVILVLVAIGSSACGRKASDTAGEPLAVVGDRVVSPEEFIRRAELAVRPRQARESTPEAKRTLLDLLVAEKLLANEAERRGLHRDPLIQKLVTAVGSRAVVRELYRDEVLGQVRVTEEELRDAYVRATTTLRLRYLRTEDRQQAEGWLRRLRQGTLFVQLVSEATGRPADDRTNVAELRWGQTDPALEDAAYRLQEIGQVSNLVHSQGMIYLLQLLEVRRSALLTESDYERQRSSLEKILRARKATARSLEFVREFMRDKDVVLKGAAFQALATELGRYIDFDHDRPPGFAPEFENLSEGEYDQARGRLADHLEDPLITFRGGHWTVRDALERLWLEGMPLDRRSPRSFELSLQQVLKDLIRDEFLAEEGRRRGLQKRARVRREVGMWRDHYLYLALREQVAATDGPAALRSLAEQLKKEHPPKLFEDRLANIELTDVPMAAVRPGTVPRLVVPAWPELPREK